jgi:hypothetical protein
MFIPIFDPTYLLFMVPPLILSGLASLLLRYWNSKYSKKQNSQGVSGAEAAQKLAQSGDFQVSLQKIGGKLSDNYNPFNKTVSLSEGVANEQSIAAVAIAAHEFGHVEQHQKGSLLMSFRNLLVPALNVSSNLGYFLIIIGLLLALTELAWVGILLFSGSVLFSLLTLPIEVDASVRAMRMIDENNLLTTTDEKTGAKRVLTGAALTYFAGLVASIANLAYFVLMVSGGSRE